jgi:hypothetical protein
MSFFELSFSSGPNFWHTNFSSIRDKKRFCSNSDYGARNRPLESEMVLRNPALYCMSPPISLQLIQAGRHLRFTTDVANHKSTMTVPMLVSTSFGVRLRILRFQLHMFSDPRSRNRCRYRGLHQLMPCKPRSTLFVTLCLLSFIPLR